MGKIKKIGLVLLIIMSLSCSTVNAKGAYSQDVKSILKQSNVMSVDVKGEKICRKINLKELNSKKSKLSKSDLNEILLALGYSQNEVSNMTQSQINKMFLDCENISTTESYIKVSEDGTTKNLNKDTCIAEAESIQQNDALNTIKSPALTTYLSPVYSTAAYSLSSNNGESTNTSTDGYMKIITTSSYISPNSSSSYYQTGWYYFFSTFTWLTSPSNRLTDAMSMYAPGFAWSQDSANYNCTMSYTLRTRNFRSLPYYDNTSDQNYMTTKTTQDLSINKDGLFYKWKLPTNYSAISVNPVTGVQTILTQTVFNLSYTVLGKARVSQYSQPCQFNLFSKYIHVIAYKSIAPSYPWTLGSTPGVTLNYVSGLTSATYSWFNSTQYNP